MNILHNQKESKGMFFIQEEDEVLAELAYSKAYGQMIVHHTQVDKELRGQNIGYELVHQAVEFARSHNLKIVPVCPFAKAIFDKKPDFSDVLAAEEI